MGGLITIVERIDELELLGISVKKMNDLNDSYDLENLIENIKQMWIQDYKTYYNDKDNNHKHETSLLAWQR